MLELLAPAGSPEAVTAAVQSGADAVYLGFGDYNARRNAKNFSQEEFVAAVSYCHIRGAKVYLTMNTLLSDRELPGAAEAIALASRTGLDAVLVQDLGAARMIRQSAPDLPIHASTQMTLHNLDGVKLAADLGMTRAVLSRELSRDQIAHICAHSPIEIEVFVHGALCMCYSGQCYFSSVIGGRSGNRGLCAQPCRMAYGWGLRPDAHPLSLKDMSLAGHMRELEEMGVACVKIEGRMKRPEYVAIVTAVYAAAIREKREPTEAELRRLSDAFSRQGFTDAYYRGEKGPEMFGVREEAPDTTALFSEVRNRYMNREAPRVPVRFYALAQKHEPVQVAAQDEQGHLFAVSGPVPEEARMRSLRDADFETHLKKTGGTPYDCQGVRAYVEPDLALPVSAINALRREALEGLSALRAKPPERRGEEYHPGVRYEASAAAPVYTVSARQAEQLSPELLGLRPALVYLALDEAASHPALVSDILARGIPFAPMLPRIVSDAEWEDVGGQLNALWDLGVREALCGNLGQFLPLRARGFALRGDFGLNVFNSQTLKELRRLGLQSACLSFELGVAQLRDLSKSLDTELPVYGRLPLMLTENCVIKNRFGRCACTGTNQLIDRTGALFPVVREYGCRNLILNSKKLFLADRMREFSRLGLWGARLMFTTENPRECAAALQRYMGQGVFEPGDYTRGLYFRTVE